MTRTILVCVLSLVPALTAAQLDADLIAEALLPLPDQLRDEAAVVTMDAHGASLHRDLEAASAERLSVMQE